MPYMTHQLHGRTHAVGAEVEWNKKHGWQVEEDPSAPEQHAAPAGVADASGEEAATPIVAPIVRDTDLRMEYAQVFGKVPHHLMKESTMRRRLDNHNGK